MQVQVTYIELFKCVLLLHHESTDLIVSSTEVSQRVRHLFFLFVTGLPRWYKIVRLQKRALLRVRSSHIQSIFVQHNSLAFHCRRLASLNK